MEKHGTKLRVESDQDRPQLQENEDVKTQELISPRGAREALRQTVSDMVTQTANTVLESVASVKESVVSVKESVVSVKESVFRGEMSTTSVRENATLVKESVFRNGPSTPLDPEEGAEKTILEHSWVHD